MVSAKKKYSMFRRILNHNMKAMNALSAIRESAGTEPNGHEENVLVLYDEMIRSIGTMAKIYHKMRDEDDSDSLSKIMEIECATKGIMMDLDQILAFSYEHSDLMEQAMGKFAKNIEGLSPELQDPLNPKFVLPSSKTPHDLIRYFHQKAIDQLFSSGQEQGKDGALSLDYSFFNGTAQMQVNLVDISGFTEGKKIIDLDDTGCRPLAAMIKGIPKRLDYKIRNIFSKNVWAFVAEDYMDLNIKMGTHIANLCTLFDKDGKSYVKFVFKEWCDQGRKKARMKYIGEIVKAVGFKTKAGPSSVEAVISEAGIEHCKEALKELGRLFVTSDNLDWALVDPKQNEDTKVLEACISRFKEGRYDIVDYAMSINPNPYKKN